MAGETFKKNGLFYKPGSGGSDEHNRGYFVDGEALAEAIPVANPGDYARVESTDTFWLWDNDDQEWKDSHKEDMVLSVNSKTGAVVLTATDVGALPSNTHIPADQVNSDWNANSGVAQILNKPTLGTMAAESANDYTKTSNLATVATTGAYSDLSGTPTIPDAVQFSTMPTASVDYLGRIVEFTGTTDSTYTNGYFYKCVSDEDPTSPTYSWTQTDVQPNAGGLPDQTGQSGKFLTTDGTDASWSDKPLVNEGLDPDSIMVNAKSGTNLNQRWSVVIDGTASNVSSNNAGGNVVIGSNASSSTQYAVAIGRGAKVTGTGGISIGTSCESEGYGIAIGQKAKVTADYAIQLNANNTFGTTNSNANTFKVYNGNGNYEIMSANGTIPTDRFTTTPSADGTYVPTLTISSGVATRSWAAPAGGATSATATLAVADWSSNTQTVNVTGVTANNNVIVAAAPASQADYTSAGIICTAQGAGTLTFTCTSTPASDLTVNVLIM